MGGREVKERENVARKQRRTFVKQLNKRSQHEEAEIQELERIISEGAPIPGSNPLLLDGALGNTYSGARTFDELPISEYTKEALATSKFINLTAVQRAALPHALAGRDILGAAKTGSGKTLSFLIPVVEKLYRLKWSRRDGLGALILTPTRELAMQIFEELRKIGKLHEMSAGLLIGGKDMKEEAVSISSMNILVATPGRLLQHMDETPGFDTSSLQSLVLDEADRILDMGFSASLDAILDNLPRERQTMLFSATQTKSVKDLARLSLSEPEYLSVHSEADSATPLKLEQAYSVVALSEKMDVVWGFVKSHLKSKTIIFLSTCKQVRFIHEVFKRLRPGVPLRALHGGMKQPKRMGVFKEFTEARAMVLFATDVAARGLDFPTVDWVLQMDCPEDAAGYIHRVGRTARYMASGRALLLLTPSERDAMLECLATAKVPIKHIKVNPKKAQPVGPALQALLSKHVELKDFAQRSLVSYVRSVFLQPNKAIFDVTKMPVVDYAQSLGLLTAPKLRFLKKVGKKNLVVEVGGPSAGGLEDSGEDGSEQPHSDDEDERNISASPSLSKDKTVGVKRQRTEDESNNPIKKKTSDSPALHPENNSDGEDDDFMRIKHHDIFANEVVGGSDNSNKNACGNNYGLEGEEDVDNFPVNKKKKPLKIRAGKSSGVRVVFDEEGKAVEPLELLAGEELGQDGHEEDDDDTGGQGMYIVKEKADDRFKAAADVLRRRDKEDKARLKQMRQQQKAELKSKKKAREAAEGNHGSSREEAVAVLGNRKSNDDDDDDDHHDLSSSEPDEGTMLNEAKRGLDLEMSHKHMTKDRTNFVAIKGKRKSDYGMERSGRDLTVKEQEALALKLLSKGSS